MVQRDGSHVCQACHFFKMQKAPKRAEGMQGFLATMRWPSVLWVGFGGTAVGHIRSASHGCHGVDREEIHWLLPNA